MKVKQQGAGPPPCHRLRVYSLWESGRKQVGEGAKGQDFISGAVGLLGVDPNFIHRFYINT